MSELEIDKHRGHIHAPFDEYNLVRLHSSQILPLVFGVVQHTERLALAIRIHQAHGHQIVLAIYMAVVAERERPVICGVSDRAPEVDDLETTLEECGSVGRRKMTVNASDCRLAGLIYVDSGNRLALVGAVFDFSGAAATNGYSER